MSYAAAGLFLCLVAPAVHAQWERAEDERVPRTATGEPDLSAPAPVAPDGRPDLSGVWLTDTEPLPSNLLTVEGDEPLPRYMLNILSDLPPDQAPLQPWAAEKLAERARTSTGPMAYCKPTGMPWALSIPLPYKIVQTRDLILILHEEDTVFRQIFLDGRKPVDDPLPRYMGYSTGRWEDGELVVDTVGLTEETWLDAVGHAHSDELHIVERFRRRDVGHLDIEVTLNDPVAFTRPVTYTITTTLIPDQDLLEYFCSDNEKSSLVYD
jgi:hypothetical protein